MRTRFIDGPLLAHRLLIVLVFVILIFIIVILFLGVFVICVGLRFFRFLAFRFFAARAWFSAFPGLARGLGCACRLRSRFESRGDFLGEFRHFLAERALPLAAPSREALLQDFERRGIELA